MHAKWYSFTQAGKSTDVMAIGSANMMLNADLHQWNDLYFMSGNHDAVQAVHGLVRDMKHDYSKRQRALNFCGVPARRGRVRRLGGPLQRVDLPAALRPDERPGAGHAGQDPVPDPGRRRRRDPDQAGAGHAHDARRPRRLHRLRDPAEVRRGLRLPRRLRPDRLPHQADPRRRRPPAAGSRCARPASTTTPTTTSTSTTTARTTSSSTTTATRSTSSSRAPTTACPAPRWSSPAPPTGPA